MNSDEEYINYLNTTTKICARAFEHVDYTNDGEWRLCCKTNAIATKAHYDTIEEFWKSDEVKEVRKSMIENKFNKMCNKNCYTHEKPGYPNSYRQKSNEIFVKKNGKDLLEKKIKFSNDGELGLNQLNSIEMRISNLCNLKCRMCSPKYSTNLNKDWVEVFETVEKSIPINEKKETFHFKKESEKYKNNPLMRLEYNEVKEILNTTKNNLKKIIFTGGEPFMEPYLYNALKEIGVESKHITIQFSSNGTKFNDFEKFNYLFKEFKQVNITLSCDGIEDTYNYIRQGSNWEFFSDQAIYISNFNVKLDFHLVVQIYNYNNIVKMANWVLKNFKDATLTFTVLDHPWYLSVYCLPKHIKEKMKNEITSYANSLLSISNYNLNAKKSAYDELIKITNKLNFKEDQKFLNQFAVVSDKYDEIQNVPITWRQLLPELNESLSKDSQAKRATE
jgi:organic radical activating enzyme